MRVVAAAVLLGALLLAGCGGSSSHTGTAGAATSQAAQAAALVRRQGAGEFDAIGRPVVLGATCSHSSGTAYSCRMLYDFTLPTGHRLERAVTFPASCAASGCKVNWGAGSTPQVIRDLGMDPSSHVAQCEKALNAVVAAFASVTPAQRAQERAACKDVHHGVYSGP